MPRNPGAAVPSRFVHSLTGTALIRGGGVLAWSLALPFAVPSPLICASKAPTDLTTLLAVPHAAADPTRRAEVAGFSDVERYLSIRSASLAGLSPDAKTVAFTTNVTGSSQIWTVPASGGWPEQITFFADRVSTVSWSPRGDWICFSKDAGGDENFQIYLVSPDGARLVALTSEPAVRHNFGSWSKDGKRIAYSSNAGDRRFFDVYEMDVETRKSRLILAKGALFTPGPFSRDGTRLIVIRENASLDDDLFLVDLDRVGGGSGAEMVLLTPHEGLAFHRVVDWTPDDRALWLISNEGRDFAALARFDFASKTLAWHRTPEWDVTGGAASLDGATLAFVTNVDGYDSLTVVDTATMKDRPDLKLSKGTIGGPAFSRDGRTLAMTRGGPTQSGDVWTADLAGAALSQVTHSSTAGIPRASFVEPTLIKYKSFDGLEIPAFFFSPGSTSVPPPCIVMPHGGPEVQTTARFSPTIQYFLSRGYAVLAPNVRGSTGYGRPFTHLDDVRKREDSVKDLVVGVGWLKETGGIDPKRIAVMGGSYGGYMTLAAITLYPDLWAAAVDSYGIANFRSFFGKTAPYRVNLRASEYGDPVKDAEFLDSISPIRKVERIATPLLVLQGANDPRVPQIEAEQIVAGIKKKGGEVEYILFPDEGHGWTKIANQIRALSAASAFLDKHLGRPASTAPNR